MNQKTAFTIKNLVQRKCDDLKIKFTKGVYRRAKRLYDSLSDDKKEEFFKYFNIK